MSDIGYIFGWIVLAVFVAVAVRALFSDVADDESQYEDDEFLNAPGRNKHDE